MSFHGSLDMSELVTGTCMYSKTCIYKGHPWDQRKLTFVERWPVNWGSNYICVTTTGPLKWWLD